MIRISRLTTLLALASCASLSGPPLLPGDSIDTVKLKLQTFIGKELQQKGDVYAWIATGTPERQLVQIQGDIKLGSVWIKLHKFQPGS